MPRKRRMPKASHVADRLPEHVEAWFRGAGAEPWEALLPHEEHRVRAWWALWGAEHPRAEPPNAPWLGLLKGGALRPMPGPPDSLGPAA